MIEKVLTGEGVGISSSFSSSLYERASSTREFNMAVGSFGIFASSVCVENIKDKYFSQ